MSGLSLFMGFSSRQTLFNYANYDGFLDAVTRARTLIAYGYEKIILLDKNAPAARLLASIDGYWNPATKLEGVGDTTTDRLAKLQ